MQAQDILSLSFENLKDICIGFGEKSFRAKQIYEWLWSKKARSFDEMTNVPLPLRNKLQEFFFFQSVTVADVQTSVDRTQKFLFKLKDGNYVEGVLIPSKNRVTACISSQVGCGLACSFCATASMGFVRNLTVGEITDQLFEIEKISLRDFSIPVSNVVYMGMGEPLQNYNPVMESIQRITDPKGHAMSPTRITLSTSGLVKFIKKLADDNFSCNLAVSLHFPDNERRERYMPVNKANNLELLSEALQYFHQKTQSRITIEYALLQGVNDSLNDASSLAQFTKQFPVKINIIEYNPLPDSVFKPSSVERQEGFVEFLEKLNLIVHVRNSKGKDVFAACGQLAKKNN